MCEDVHVKSIHCVWSAWRYPDPAFAWPIHHKVQLIRHDWAKAPTTRTGTQAPAPSIARIRQFIVLLARNTQCHAVLSCILTMYIHATCKLAWLLHVMDSWPGCGEQGTTAEGNSGNIAYADVNAYTEHYLCVLNLSMMGRKRLSLKAIHSSHAAYTHLLCWCVVCTRISLPSLCRFGNSTVSSTGSALPTVLPINCWTCTVVLCALGYIMWEEAKGGVCGP